jgi:hypothetical protein
MDLDCASGAKWMKVGLRGDFSFLSFLFVVEKEKINLDQRTISRQ